MGRKPVNKAARPEGSGIMFGEEVHRLRRANGLSLDELAAETGVPRATLSDAERDRYAPRGRTVDALADRLAPPGRADELALLAAETYRRIEMDLDGLDRERIDLLVRFRRRLGALTPQTMEAIRSALASAG